MGSLEPISDKEKFLESFNKMMEDDFLPAEWSDTKKARVQELTDKAHTKKAMYSSIPLMCRGSKCQFAEVCPLLKEDLAPLNHRCPIESKIVAYFMDDYMKQFEVEEDNVVEASMIREIVNIDVQEWRASTLLSMNDFIQENVVGIDPEGDPIMKKELHLSIDLEDKLHKRKQQLFKVFLATRESRLKAGMAQLDPATLAASLMHAYKQKAFQQDEDLKKRLGLVDHDDYIDIPLTETIEK